MNGAIQVTLAFGILYTVLAAVGGFYLMRIITGINPPKNADDRQALAFGMMFFWFLAAIAALVTFIMLFFGHAGIPALVTVGLLGASFGTASRG